MRPLVRHISDKVEDDGLVLRLPQKQEQILWFQAHGCAVGHGVEIYPLVTSACQVTVQHHLHTLLFITEERESCCTSLADLQLVQHQRLFSEPQVPTAETQTFGHVTKVHLSVVTHRQQPQTLLLFVFQEEILSDHSIQMRYMRHHLLHRKHLQQTAQQTFNK